MEEKRWIVKAVCVGAVLAAVWILSARTACAHCDTLDGPVVKEARAALEKGDVTPVLKWVKKDDEAAVREAFQKTLAVRMKGQEAKDLADMYFLETLVRIHRAGEGEPYTGLQPAGAQINPALAVAEKALAAGNPEALKNFLTLAINEGLQEKFKQAEAKKNFKQDDVAAGRQYVEAYVTFMQYVEGIYEATGKAAHAHHQEHEPVPAHKHEH